MEEKTPSTLALVSIFRFTLLFSLWADGAKQRLLLIRGTPPASRWNRWGL